MVHSTSSSQRRVSSHQIAQDGVSMGPQTWAKDQDNGADPLRKGNGGCPLSVSPDYFQNPMRAQGMERISFAGQHMGRGGEYVGGGPRAGSVHRG